MPAPTTRYNLPHFDDSSAFDPIQAPFNAISDALEGSLGAAFPRAADLTALAAITGMPDSALARVTEGGALFSYDLATTKWVQQTRAAFASDAARDSAYAKASGAYKVANSARAATDTGDYTFNGTNWAPLNITGVFTRSSNFTVGTSIAAVPFTTAATQRGLIWSASSNPSRISPVVAGHFLVSGMWQINSTGTATVQVFVNGAGIPGVPPMVVTNASGACLFSVNQPVDLGVGDILEIAVFISTGSQPWIAANRVNVDLLGLR